MLSLIFQLWSWMPGPLPYICTTATFLFFLILLFKLLQIVVGLIKDIMGIIKALLLNWGIGL